MTQAELVRMLISKVNGLTEQNKCLQIELDEAQAVNRELKGTVRCTVDALSVAKGGYQVQEAEPRDSRDAQALDRGSADCS